MIVLFRLVQPRNERACPCHVDQLSLRCAYLMVISTYLNVTRSAAIDILLQFCERIAVEAPVYHRRLSGRSNCHYHQSPGLAVLRASDNAFLG